MKAIIKRKANQLHAQVVNWRRHIHAHPELSFEEYETSKYIASILTDLGIDYTDGWAKTGIVAIITGKNPKKKVVALRADIDALPILEKNKVSYKSKNDGVMHACGHDVHTANMLGAAALLSSLKNKFEGTVKIIFQPGEEKLPGGASMMIKEGVLKSPKPDLIMALHVHPPLEVGTVGFRPGVYMASADELYVSVKGKGGHAAVPQNCIDPILITSHLITALQQLVSRRANPNMPSVLSFGKINSIGGATNIIPNEVRLEGTFRTFDETWRKQAHKIMKHTAESLAASMGGVCDFTIAKGYPFLLNNESLTREMHQAAKAYMGDKQAVSLPIRMTAEDFAFYSHQIPACFFRLGTGNKKRRITSSVHTDTFNIDEEALLHSVGLTSWLTIQALKS